MFCAKVKEFLSQRGIEFTERDVSEDADAMNELKKIGIMSTPVTQVDGKTVVGFDQQKLEELVSGL